jgi:hypothetical protein
VERRREVMTRYGLPERRARLGPRLPYRQDRLSCSSITFSSTALKAIIVASHDKTAAVACDEPLSSSVGTVETDVSIRVDVVVF